MNIREIKKASNILYFIWKNFTPFAFYLPESEFYLTRLYVIGDNEIMNRFSVGKIICYLAIAVGIIIVVVSLAANNLSGNLYAGIFPIAMGLIGLSRIKK